MTSTELLKGKQIINENEYSALLHVAWWAKDLSEAIEKNSSWEYGKQSLHEKLKEKLATLKEVSPKLF